MSTPASNSTHVDAETAKSDLKMPIARLAAVICGDVISNGDRALLKRWAPPQPVPLVFYRLWLRNLDGNLPSERATPTWMLIAWGLALMGRSAHRPGRSLGQALAESGFSDTRLERLLDAPQDVLPDLFMSAVRFLASKDAAFDWVDAASLLLARESGKRESVRRRIATSYYRHLPKE